MLVFIGGQAVGMRSMAIYELGSDYVNYGRGLGLSDNRITRYIFRNAMLPQITGLALSIGGLVGGALVTELVFSYPGIGTLLFNAISTDDYPVIQAITLIITLAVLVANFLVDIVYGFIDPRIRAARDWRPLMKSSTSPPGSGSPPSWCCHPVHRSGRAAARRTDPDAVDRRALRPARGSLRCARHRQRGPERAGQPGVRHPHVADGRPGRRLDRQRDRPGHRPGRRLPRRLARRRPDRASPTSPWPSPSIVVLILLAIALSNRSS